MPSSMKIMVMLAIWITLLTGCIDPNAKQRIQWEEDRREKLAEDERKSREFWIKQKAFEEDLHRQMKELAEKQKSQPTPYRTPEERASDDVVRELRMLNFQAREANRIELERQSSERLRSPSW